MGIMFLFSPGRLRKYYIYNFYSGSGEARKGETEVCLLIVS